MRLARAGGLPGMGGTRRDRAARAAERRGWARRGGQFRPARGEQWALALLQSSMPKGAEQEECREACRHCARRRPESLHRAQDQSEGRGWAAGTRAGGGRGAGAEVGAGGVGGARSGRRARKVEGHWGGKEGRRTCLGGVKTL